MMFEENDTIGTELDEMIEDIIISVQAAQTMADRFGKEFCLLSDLSVQEATRYTRLKAVEIVKPRRGNNVCRGDGG